MNLLFKKDLKDDLFSWLYVSGHSINDISGNDILNVTKSKEYENRFHDSLDLAGFLAACLEKHILMRFSPFLSKLFEDVQWVPWKYEILSNDMYGTGIDKGFVSEEEHESEQEALFVTDKFDELKSLPEDTFGDSFSHITIFGLNTGRKDDLRLFLQASDTPDLSMFLQPKELFIHIIYGKDYSYLDLVLIKSKIDIQDDITAFRNATNAGN